MVAPYSISPHASPTTFVSILSSSMYVVSISPRPFFVLVSSFVCPPEGTLSLSSPPRRIYDDSITCRTMVRRHIKGHMSSSLPLPRIDLEELPLFEVETFISYQFEALVKSFVFAFSLASLVVSQLVKSLFST